VRKGAPKNQDYEKLGKGKIVAKDLRINHPTNASIKIHSGNNPREPTTDVGIIWTTENRNQFC
jgi:hypothetical protein